MNIFISYSRKDEIHAERLYDDFCSRGIKPWFDKKSLLPGQIWKDEIEKAIREADFIILLLSNNSVNTRGYFQKELRITYDVFQTIPIGHIYLIPVRLDECQIPEPLAMIHYLDMFHNWNDGFNKLLKSIEIQRSIQSAQRVNIKMETGDDQISVLLVNDEPAAMNFIVDYWKSCGIKVDYAFDVHQAIRSIQNATPTVIVSDLSHFARGNLITDRAAFEILEWAKKLNINTKIIVTCAEINDERRRIASELEAVGICNNVKDLFKLMEKATGVKLLDDDDLLGKKPTGAWKGWAVWPWPEDSMEGVWKERKTSYGTDTETND